MNITNVKTRQVSICEVCNKSFIFNSLTEKGRFCSYQCCWISKKGIVPKYLKLFKKGEHPSRATEFKKGHKVNFRNAAVLTYCQYCNTPIKDYPCTKRKFCSYNCYWRDKKGSIVLSRRKKVNRICAYCKNTFQAYPNQLKKRGGIFCSKKCFYSSRIGKKFSLQHRKKLSDSQIKRREKNHLWRGGITELNQQIRTSFQYAVWREKIFTRDNYTCQNCLSKGVKLNADHIIPFALILKQNNIQSLEDAFLCHYLWDINNGKTLCVSCHKETPTWGIGTLNLLNMMT